MVCQRQCNRLDIESNRVEKEQQSIRKMIMKNETRNKSEWSRRKEKRSKKKKKNVANEQRYFCLNEKQSHRGSLRLCDATAFSRRLLFPSKNTSHDTLHLFAITKNPKCNELVCFCWSSSVHVKPYHFLPCMSSTEWKQIALNVVSPATIFGDCVRRRARATSTTTIFCRTFWIWPNVSVSIKSERASSRIIAVVVIWATQSRNREKKKREKYSGIMLLQPRDSPFVLQLQLLFCCI